MFYQDAVGGRVLRAGLAGLIALSGMMLCTHEAKAQAAAAGSATVPVVMLSDLHFDPFHDPAKVPALVKAPMEQWPGILNAPDSPGQEARFAALQKACKAKEYPDTPWALLKSSLLAAKEHASSAGFVTVSGDLLVHDLDCRYRASMGLEASTTDDQSLSAAFAEKTTVFVMKQVESTFAKQPVYLALGNNDSRCNHNRLDPHDAYLKASASAVIDGLRGVSAAEKAAALVSYQSAGYYAVTMAAPMNKTRLLVVNDIYMMPKYATCEADDTDQKGAQEQMAWLEAQLQASHEHGESVWLLGHLPPAVNPDASLAAGDSFCPGGKVTKYQTGDDLAVEMMTHADVLKLGLFGHTHMDELHLLRGKDAAVPVKVVGSVSPISGNRPSFTVGLVSPASSRLMDYTVYEASNLTGIAATWTKEYAFDETYHEPSFSGDALSDLIGRLRADTSAGSVESQSYMTHFMKGSSGKKMSSSWTGYVCSLDNPTAKTFRKCVCKAN